MKLSDYVVGEIARVTGSRHVFMLSGGMAMHLIDSFGRHPGLQVVPMHHEQAAGIAATTYGRVRGTPGIVLVTAGPGALNAVTPCGGAYMESVPLVVVSGQVSRANSRQGHAVRQRGIQEVEIIDVVRSITKYAAKIEDPSTVREHVERALALAVGGRPGPVWLDIPVDVQAAEIDPASQRGYEASRESGGARGSDFFDRILRELRSAERPMLILGHGLRLAGAAAEARRLIDALGLPFQTTWNGMDLVGDDHPLACGRANVFGPRFANILIQNADYVLAIGARFGIQHTGYNVEGFCRGAHLVMVDIDPEEMRKPGLAVDEEVVMDAGDFARGLLEAVSREGKAPSHDKWLGFCSEVKGHFPAAASLAELAGQPYVDPKFFIDRLSDELPADAVIPFGSSGQGHTIFGGMFRCKPGQRVFTFKGLAAMGYGLPCAVGAAFAAPDRPVFTLIGEGGLQLNLHALQNVKHHRLPLKIIVFNNGGYHSIHMTQTIYFGGHFVASGPESGVSFPPVGELAKLFGFSHVIARNNEGAAEAIREFVRCPGAAFLEVMIDPARAIEPKVASMKLPDGRMVSRPLEDMAPLLPREELARYMHIPLME
ncbi:MAG TPA: thiamine pyrophosphate-binding protein [Verrucomicrobiae bacterium]|nr:thiamine pyrophosphate-binding protein [Verrucomicrobiae bacterium]